MTAAFDEMRAPDGSIRPAYAKLAQWLARVPPDVLAYRRREAEFIFRRMGLEVRDGIFIQANGYLLLELRSIGILPRL